MCRLAFVDSWQQLVDNPAGGGFELHGVARLRQVFQPAGWTYFGDHAVTDEHRPIMNCVQFVRKRTAPGPGGAAQSQQLPSAPNKNCIQTYTYLRLYHGY